MAPKGAAILDRQAPEVQANFCRESKQRKALQRVPRRAHEIAQHGYVWLVGADAPRIHGKPKPLGEFQIHARIIKL